MQFEVTREFIDHLMEIINTEDEVSALGLLEKMHAADIAEISEQLTLDQARFLFLLLDGEKAADVLSELEDDDRVTFLKSIPSETIAKQFIEEMDSDDAADILADLSEEKKQEVLSHIEDIEQAGDIIDLLNYNENTAGGLMAKEYVAVNINWTVTQCINEIRQQAEEMDEIYFVYVVDNDNVLKGVLSLKRLLLSRSSTKMTDLCNSNIFSVNVDMPGEEVANAMHKYDLVVMPVVDDTGRLQGKISIDDVVDLIREEAGKDYQMISGIVNDVESSDKVWHITKARIPWLLIGLLGGILGAQVISYYEGDIIKYAGLALFLPLIAAMGGNVGVQSSSIVVQGLANNSMGIDSMAKKLGKELAVAMIAGMVCSSLIFGYNMIFSDTLALTITVSMALFAVIMFASLFGTFVPLLLKRLKIDPALATGPFITTVNDIMGLFIYLMLGRIIFEALNLGI